MLHTLHILPRFGSEKTNIQAFLGSVKYAGARYSTLAKSLALAFQLDSKAPDIARVRLSLNLTPTDEMRPCQSLDQGGRGSMWMVSLAAATLFLRFLYACMTLVGHLYLWLPKTKIRVLVRKSAVWSQHRALKTELFPRVCVLLGGAGHRIFNPFCPWCAAESRSQYLLEKL